jgi:hypothetical protein
MIGDTCGRCGYTPSTDKAKARNLYFSAMFDETICVDGVACARRAEKAASKRTCRTCGVDRDDPNHGDVHYLAVN